MKKNLYNVDGKIIGYILLTIENKIEFHVNEDMELSIRQRSMYDVDEQPVQFFKTLGMLNTSRMKFGKIMKE